MRSLFAIVDATLNNGVFRPSGSRSIWLFVTEDKTADRPQLEDRLEGDTLLWTGQPAGRTDHLIVEHLANGDEVLLFYRKHRSAHPGGGFRYEGPFLYQSHQGSKPAHFILSRDIPAKGKPAASVGEDDAYDPKNTAEGRAKTLAEVTRRLGQPRFRKELIKAYGGTCAISGCKFLPILEAAHIRPYDGKSTNHVTNGLLLRADLHTLFDLGLIAINEDYTLEVGEPLAGTEYAHFSKLKPPKDSAKSPSVKALAWHREHIANKESQDLLARKLGIA